jgi:hypothetical protein
MAIELTTATSAELSGIRQSLRSVSLKELFPSEDTIFIFDESDNFKVINGTVVDFKNFGNVTRFGYNLLVNKGITTILNANELTNLENVGTAIALNLIGNNLSESVLNQLFTDLPPTTKTATIHVAGNTGAATCDPTIATNKGYTVITS